MTTIKFLRVTSIRSKAPAVLVAIGEQFVRWKPKRGWDCTCLTIEDEYECEHIMTAQDLLDPRVLTTQENRHG